MKKKYVFPEAFTISLSLTCPLATSEPDIEITPGVDPVPGDELDVKGHKSIWEEEW